ncbi:MAG: metallophosphoesterase [Ilumatobacteraceae bacterium]|nr:metallophosphoesterase [Ilumatobacteraceae bacterium]
MDATTLAVIAGVIALLGVASVLALARRRPQPLGLCAVVLPGVVVAGATLVAVVPVASAARISQVFAVGHLAYLVTGIALPAVGVALFIGGVLRGARWPVWIVAAVLLIPAPLTWYGTHVAPYRLTVERAEVPLHPGRTGTGAVRVGVLSDLQTGHVGAHERRAVRMLLALDPDIIVIPGDLHQGSDAGFERELPAFRQLLGQLEAPGGVYAVRGDTDRGDDLDRLVAGTGVEILDYDVATVEVGDRTVRLGGSGWRWAGPEASDLITELEAGDPGDVRLLLAHRPDVVLRLPASADVDLTIAGHTHGGQIAVPFYGPVFGSTRLPRAQVSGGLHEVADNPLFVSSGVGMVRIDAPQVRLFTRPAVGLIVLR